MGVSRGATAAPHDHSSSSKSSSNGSLRGENKDQRDRPDNGDDDEHSQLGLDTVLDEQMRVRGVQALRVVGSL